ncbi:hypothetical protein GCM10012280_60810 [Wenjunlia tyrosinilytica]|uniref:Uncharacterized protein n=1 Tax=Wenjunlia tyrosinilytica TaxID=1544741 RepID=A0A917ZVP9_9ACTN|nr:hypothetical protein GCM10012280_60810 [Wenjunlia tyrosinilytica]
MASLNGMMPTEGFPGAPTFAVVSVMTAPPPEAVPAEERPAAAAESAVAGGASSAEIPNVARTALLRRVRLETRRMDIPFSAPARWSTQRLTPR